MVQAIGSFKFQTKLTKKMWKASIYISQANHHKMEICFHEDIMNGYQHMSTFDLSANGLPNLSRYTVS